MSIELKPLKKEADIAIAELLDACKKGNRKAQFQLYSRYADAMLNVSMRIVNDLQEAEDILQNAFIKAFRNLDRFREESTFGTWLKRIVVNESINMLKKRRLEVVREVEIADFPEETQAGPFTPDMKHVEAAIRELPTGYRVVFTLYLIEGYDHQEISEILGISESASKSQYSRAKQKLRKVLQPTV